MEERLWWIALYLVPGVGSALFRRLVEKFKSPERVFSASREEIEGVEGAAKEAALQIKSFDIESHLKRELELVEEHNISIVTTGLAVCHGPINPWYQAGSQGGPEIIHRERGATEFLCYHGIDLNR